jgi:hypothetical protein
MGHALTVLMVSMLVMCVMLGMTVVKEPLVFFLLDVYIFLDLLSACALVLAIIWPQPKDIERNDNFIH